MKTEEIAVLGAAALAVYLIVKSQRAPGASVFGQANTGTATQGSAGVSASAWVDEIFNSNGTPYGNGWRYFENGVAIDPSGNYYQNGAMVWRAPA